MADLKRGRNEHADSAQTIGGGEGGGGSGGRSGALSRLAHSSGGVAFRRSEHDGEIEIALIATRGGTRWQLPKGSREEGESSLETAIREVEEETGLITVSAGFLLTIDFWYSDTYRKNPPVRVHKMVDFYLLRVVDGVLSDASHEVDDVAWFSLAQARDILTYASERRALLAAIAALDGMD